MSTEDGFLAINIACDTTKQGQSNNPKIKFKYDI